MVRVQAEDFDVGAELAALRRDRPDVGAIACFIGVAREFSDGRGVAALTLEHYPGMTERALDAIVARARARWPQIDARVVHRVGTLQPTEQIVLVAVAAAHRGAAFAACEFVMDCLKTEAPFWKSEATPEGRRWVEARASDDAARRRWDEPPAGTGTE